MKIEISVRGFLTSDEVNVTPKMAFVVDHDKGSEIDWEGVARALKIISDQASKELKLTAVRSMTEDEISDYRRVEADEARESGLQQDTGPRRLDS